MSFVETHGMTSLFSGGVLHVLFTHSLSVTFFTFLRFTYCYEIFRTRFRAFSVGL